MSTKITDSKKALVQIYVNAALGYSTAYPNAEFTIPASGVWVALNHIGVDLNHFATGRDRLTGLLQLNVVGQKDVGTLLVYDAIDKIKAAFTIGRKHTQGGKDYIIKRFTHTPVLPDPQYRPTSILSIYWESIQ